MDALMAALVVALLAGGADRFAWLVAVLADRFGTGLVLASAAVAVAGASALAVAGGILLAPRLTPDAKQMFLAFALLAAGAGALFPVRAPDRLARWRIGAVATSLLGLFILAVGDATQFAVLALAARSEVPWGAAVGAVLGTTTAVAPAAVLGEAAWRHLPTGIVRRGGGAVLLLWGAWLGLGAARLI